MSGYRTPASPSRSPSECKSGRGVFAPVVDRSRCEGKAECVTVCPFDVFEVRRIEDEDFAQLGLLARMKSRAHGRKTAYTPRASDCEACGKCVAACPEKAITLARTSSREKIVREVRRRYGALADQAMGELDRYEGSVTADRDRVQAAILRLSDGSVDNLRRWVEVAASDYRDVLGPAEYPTDAHDDEVRRFNAWSPDEATVAETTFEALDPADRNAERVAEAKRR